MIVDHIFGVLSGNLEEEVSNFLIVEGSFEVVVVNVEVLTEEETCGMDTVLRHVDHLLSLGGEKHLSLGGDLDGCEKLPEPMTGIDGYRYLIDAMLAHGIPEQTVADICFNNFMEVFKTCDM